MPVSCSDLTYIFIVLLFLVIFWFSRSRISNILRFLDILLGYLFFSYTRQDVSPRIIHLFNNLTIYNLIFL